MAWYDGRMVGAMMMGMGAVMVHIQGRGESVQAAEVQRGQGREGRSMGQGGDGEGEEEAVALVGEWAGKADKSWSQYTAQAQELGRKALESKDQALRSARSHLEELQDASSHHLSSAQKLAHTLGQQYKQHEDLFFHKLKEGVHAINRYPNLVYGVAGITAIFAFRRPRRMLWRHTFGRFQSEEAMVARAETKVKEMRQSVDLLKNETKKLEERARLAEEELQRGKTKLKNAGGQLSSLVKSIYKTESHARGLTDNLRELPGREALRLRAEVASMAAEAKQQRSVLDKRVSRIAGYGIPV